MGDLAVAAAVEFVATAGFSNLIKWEERKFFYIDI
jgi:hypothetical protein